MKGTPENATFVDAAALEAFAASVLEGAGLDEECADVVANTLVDANLRGVDTHGVVRLEPYAERIESGGLNPDPDVRVESVREAAAVVDGDGGPGQVATLRAMEGAITLAEDAGGAFVGVRNSNHFGTAAYYTNVAAERGYIGLCMTHAGPNVAPFGGADPYFGTNPIAVGLPGEEFPVTLDMATSVTAKGSVILAEEEGEEIPPEWAIDASGRPTTDPADFHALQPLGGPKGYGLAFVVDALCGVLLDTVFGEGVPTMYDDLSSPQELGHFVGAINVEAFTDLTGFHRRLSRMIAEVKSTRPGEGFEEVLVPGEPEARTKKERLEEGIPLGSGVSGTLQSLGDRYGREFPA
ncbi:Ldh family oxidoreductase [Halegenticoccus soli]|uniref:Ldh family oxidoreductase n=1 Tax=Halegenticoccus soli TaxID=1985678 RepID=UPI000C6E3219|nr:Ldh family oxidoreductase [Halegenticoccus soli]